MSSYGDSKIGKLDNAEAKELARQLAVKLFEEAETKRVFKEAIDEWMDRRFAEFAKGSLRWLLVMLFGTMVTIILWSQGYVKIK